MNEENRDVKIAAGLDRDKDPGEQPAPTSGADRRKRLRFWVNWVLAQSRSSRRNF
jgi:hypothetical protein